MSASPSEDLLDASLDGGDTVDGSVQRSASFTSPGVAIADGEFPGRFEYLGELGQGGMGRVRLAYDRVQRTKVAVKEVGRVEGEVLLRFKREFRAAKALSHPNLVKLGELFEEAGQWSYSMELVDGESFVRYVRPKRDEPSTPASYASYDDATVVPTPRTELTDGVSGTPANVNSSLDEGRLRHSLVQLVNGLRALHAGGFVHRDIKSGNVLVATSGRVVVLDFGLAAELEAGTQKDDIGVFGTPAYMAPEQAMGAAVGPPADWYAVGVMLYQALTGHVPFKGASGVVLRLKQTERPVAPSELLEGVPADLDALCMDLLSIDPSQRPNGDEVLQRLGARGSVARADQGAAGVLAAGPVELCVGREVELAELDRHYAAVRGKEPRSVLVRGESGIGKSALIAEALRRWDALGPERPWVLRGRCHPHEKVPYKAFDALMDQLGSELPRVLGADEIEAVLGDRREPLAQIFPVFRDLDELRPEPSTEDPNVDPRERQARALAAFRALFQSLGARRHLVLWIDDLQWADEPSYALIEELLREPNRPPLLLLGTERDATQPRHAVLDADRWKDLPLGPLDAGAARTLARSLAAETSSGGSNEGIDLEALVAESGGHPMFLDVMLRRARIGVAGGADGAQLSLRGALRAHIASMEPVQRGIIETLSVAVRALDPRSIAAVVDADPGAVAEASEELLRGKWVRRGTGRDQDALAVYHDQIREAVEEELPAVAARTIHGRLADSMVEAGAQLARVVDHLRLAGRVDEARTLAERAAAEAFSAFAFADAADLYAFAAEAPSLGEERRRALTILRAQATANAGRAGDAAKIYLDAAGRADDDAALALKNQAVIHLLAAGALDEVVQLQREVSKALGIDLPRSLAGLLFKIAVGRMSLTEKALRTPPRQATTSERSIMALDTCWALGNVLSIYDPMLGAYYATEFARRALREGSMAHYAKALALEATTLTVMRSAKEGLELIGAAEAAAAASGDPSATAVVACHTSGINTMSGVDALKPARLAEENLERFEGLAHTRTFELGGLRIILATNLSIAGRYKEYRSKVGGFLREAEARGDRFELATLGTASELMIVWLAFDQPTEGLAMIRRRLEALPSETILLPHLGAMLSEATAARYEGRSAEGVEIMRQGEVAFRKALHLRLPLWRAFFARDYSACLVDLWDARGTPISWFERRKLEGVIRDCEGYGDPLHVAHAKARRAALARFRGDRNAAIALLREAFALYTDGHFDGYAGASRYYLGRLLDDAGSSDEGTTHRAEGLRLLVARGVVDPERFARAIVPGFDSLVTRATKTEQAKANVRVGS